MDEFVYYNELYDLYKELLTTKQRKYFEDYYFSNLSYSEIADNYGVSRNACFRQIQIVTLKLNEYEEKLGLRRKRDKILEIAKEINNSKIREKLENIM